MRIEIPKYSLSSPHYIGVVYDKVKIYLDKYAPSPIKLLSDSEACDTFLSLINSNLNKYSIERHNSEDPGISLIDLKIAILLTIIYDDVLEVNLNKGNHSSRIKRYNKDNATCTSAILPTIEEVAKIIDTTCGCFSAYGRVITNKNSYEFIRSIMHILIMSTTGRDINRPYIKIRGSGHKFCTEPITKLLGESRAMLKEKKVAILDVKVDRGRMIRDIMIEYIDEIMTPQIQRSYRTDRLNVLTNLKASVEAYCGSIEESGFMWKPYYNEFIKVMYESDTCTIGYKAKEGENGNTVVDDNIDDEMWTNALNNMLIYTSCQLLLHSFSVSIKRDSTLEMLNSIRKFVRTIEQ